MVLGLLLLAALPTVAGVGNAVSAQKRQNDAAKEKVKFNLTAAIDGMRGFCVLANGKLYVNLPNTTQSQGHKFCGYYFTYPSPEQYTGLVSTIQDDPPMLNWIFVDKEASSVCFGGRKDTLGHVIGPWGWSEDENLLALQDEVEVFCAVREEVNGEWKWAVYWDPYGEIAQRTHPSRHRRITLQRELLLGVESRYV